MAGMGRGYKEVWGQQSQIANSPTIEMLFFIAKYLNSISIPIVLAPETVHFALRNGLFRSLKQAVLQSKMACSVSRCESDYNSDMVRICVVWIYFTYHIDIFLCEEGEIEHPFLAKMERKG